MSSTKKLKDVPFINGGLSRLLLSCAIFSALGHARAADWPTFRGNNARTGFTAEQARPPLVKAWEFQAGGGILSSPVIFDDIVYFGARDNKVYALNARTGAPLWSFLTGARVDATPAVAGGAVYFPSADGLFYALDRLTGGLIWMTQQRGAPSVSSPLVVGGRVFVGSGLPDKKLKVFGAAAGGLLYEFRAGQPVDSAPSTDGTTVYFGANDGKVYSLDRNTFSPGWSYQTMGGSYGMSTVAVSSGVVYALPGHDEKKPLAFNAADGLLLANAYGPFGDSTSWEQVGSPLVTGDRLYFSGGAVLNRLFALEARPAGASPAYLWASSPTLGGTSPIGVLSSPAMANDILYAGDADGRLLAFDPSGAPVTLVSDAADVTFSSPVYSSPGISNGMVFVATMGGKLIAYKAANAVSISSPAADAVASGTIAVEGYISNTALTGYTLEYSTGGMPEVWQQIISSATANAVEKGVLAEWDTTALPNGAYTLKLTALGAGTGNTAVLPVRINSAPAAPSGLAADDVPGDSGNRVRLGWAVSVSSGITAQRVYRKGEEEFSEIASLGPDATSYTDASAATGTLFTYAVRAFDGYLESENSNTVSTCSINDTGDSLAPAAIGDLRAEPGPAGGAATLYWTAPGNDGNVGSPSLYVIRCSSSADYDWTGPDGRGLVVSTIPAGDPAGSAERAEQWGLFGGVTYYFRVLALDSVPNPGPLSAPATAWALPDFVPPLPVTGLVVADTPNDAGGSLDLSWALSPDDGAGAGDVYGYKVYRRGQSSAYVPGAPYAVLPKGTNGYTDAAAPENYRFYYSVAAFDSTNESPLADEAAGISVDNWRFFDASQGISFSLPDGASLNIPGDAAPQNGNVIFLKLEPAAYQPLFRIKTAGGANPTGIVYELRFKNAAARLLKPALLTLPYTPGDVAGMNEENLRLYALSAGTWQMVNSSKPDLPNRKVTAEIKAPAIYRVMEYLPSGGLFDENEVYTYPNPAKGDTVTFKFRLSNKAFVKIDVYNVAGEQVASLEKSNCPAGQTSEITWRVRNVASGVYIYRVRAESASGNKSIIKKLAVIH